MSIVSSNQINYKTVEFAHPKYRFLQLFPQSGSQTQTQTGSGGQTTTIELPIGCYNLSKSIISFTVTPPQPSDGAKANFMIKDAVTAFRRVVLKNRAGQFICDLSEAQNYTNIVNKAETKLEDMLSYDIWANGRGQGQGLRANNNSAISETTATVPSKDFGNQGTANGVVPSRPVIETQYVEPGVINVPNPVLQYRIPMSMFPNTIFSLDRDIFWGEILLVEFTWGSTNKVGWESIGVLNPAATALPFNGNVEITNLKFFACLEENPIIANECKAITETTEGVNILHDFVYTSRQTIGMSSAAGIITRTNRSQGMTLKKIYTSIYKTVESVATSYDHSNLPLIGATLGNKIDTLFTTMDNRRLQDFNLLCSGPVGGGDDYMLLKEKLKGSCILDQDMYTRNWFFLDSWEEERPFSDMPIEEQNYMVGLDLSSEKDYQFNTTTQSTNPNLYFTYTIVQRMVNISPRGLTIL